jgi:putative endopeptidase
VASFALSPYSPTPHQQSSQDASATTATVPVVLSCGIIKVNMNLAIKPGDDFFNYVNGNYLDNTQNPADKSSYGGFSVLRDEAQENVMAIIKSSSEAGFFPRQ